MELTGRGLRRGGAVVVTALAIGLVLWRWAGIEPVSEKLEGTLLDLRFRVRGPLPPPESVIIVAIDDAALARIGAYAPLRAALAEALPAIAAAGPRVIAVDLILADRTEADDALAEALGRVAPVLLGVAATAGAPLPVEPAQDAALSRSAIPVVVGGAEVAGAQPALVLPAEALSAAALLAHVNVAPASDGSVRGVPLAVPAGDGRLLPSMALAAARHWLGVERGAFVRRDGGYLIGDVVVPTDPAGRLVLDHYGPAGSVPTVGLLDVLDGRTPDAAFAGRAVFVGSAATSLRDAFATPFGATIPGVELQATATANIVEGRTLRRGGVAFGLTALLALAAALVALAAFRLERVWLSLIAGAACWGATLAALQYAFAGHGLWLDGAAVLGALAAGTVVGGWSRLSREHRGRENLAHYISPSLVGQLAETAHPAFDGREQDVGILFVDVAGYSGMVETERPAEIADFLRALHGLFEEAAERHSGVIVDFQGDGALLVFGLPDPSAADAANALDCAETLLAGRDGVQAAFLSGPVVLRVSVHFGPVACAVLGGRRHAQVSVTGDAVNVTSRLQEVAKAHGAALVATRAVLDAAGADAGPGGSLGDGQGDGTVRGMQRLGVEPLRGRRGEVEIWGRAADPAADPADGRGAGLVGTAGPRGG